MGMKADDPTGEIRRATLLVMKFLEERGEFGDYEAIEKKVRSFLEDIETGAANEVFGVTV